jgi:hypothetical protein
VIIRERQDAAVQVIQAAPGSDSPVPPLVLDAWRRGLLNDASATSTDSPASVP